MRLAKEKVDIVLARAREELPPLPPPLTSGWRPVPLVGDEREGWVNAAPSGAEKRSHDEGGGGAWGYDDQPVDDRDDPPAKRHAYADGPGREQRYDDRYDDRYGAGPGPAALPPGMVPPPPPGVSRDRPAGAVVPPPPPGMSRPPPPPGMGRARDW